VRFVVLVGFLIACGGANEDMTVAEPVASQAQAQPEPQPLPTVSAPPPPTQEAPPPPQTYTVQRSDTTATVNFVEARKHPSSGRADAAIRGAPAWRAFPTIDPIADIDWMTQHEDDMLVFHNAPDAKIDAAIAQIARPTVVQAPNVKAWRGIVNGADIVFLRAQSHYVRIAPARHLDQALREITAGPPASPAFHANEAVRLKILHPAGSYSVPVDISEARIWIDSVVADASADIYGEADCPSPAAAAADAVAIAEEIKRNNSLGVRVLTAGLLNKVDITTDGNKVKMHVHATQQQIDSVVPLAARYFGSP
jgi:hypothetical protein